jgi:hypothetical protein
MIKGKTQKKYDYANESETNTPGIICIESEFEITEQCESQSLDSEPLMEFLSKLLHVNYIYRRVATKAELFFYLRQFAKPEYKSYNVLYFSFHGSPRSIYVDGDDCDVPLDEILDEVPDIFRDRFVHFCCCSTLKGNEDYFEELLSRSKAKVISGYNQYVRTYESAIHDVGMFREYLFSVRRNDLFNRLKAWYGSLEDQLGFTHFPNYPEEDDEDDD